VAKRKTGVPTKPVLWGTNTAGLSFEAFRRNYMAKIFKHRTDVPYFDYKDFKTLQRYVNMYGQIETRKKTGLTESQQRQLARAIKRARHLALMPFVANS
jgi:small subunit ribosomal protein S18